MISSSKASLTKKLHSLSLGVLVSLALLTILVNLVLWGIKGKFCGSLSPEFPHRFSVDAVFYLPPYFLIVKNAALSEASSETAVVTSGWSVAQADIGQSIRSRSPVIEAVSCYGIFTRESTLLPFVRGNFRQLVAYLAGLPLRDLRIRMHGVRFDTDQRKGEQKRFLSSAKLEISGDTVRLKSITEIFLHDGRHKHFVPMAPVSCDLRLRSQSGDFMFESIELSRENFYVKTWGVMQEDFLLLNGFVFLNTSFREDIFSLQQGTLLKRAIRFISGQPPVIPRLELSDADFFVLDLDGRIRIASPQVLADKLSFSVNNIPVVVSGTAVLGPVTSVDCLLSADFGKAPVKKNTQRLKKLSCGWKGAFDAALFRGDGFLRLDFADERLRSIKDITVNFREATVRFDNPAVSIATFRSADMRCVSGSDTSYSVFDRPALACKRIGTQRYIVGGIAGLERGKVTARALLDVSEFPWHLESLIRLRGIDAYGLRNLLVHFSKIHGEVFSQMKFKTHPAFLLKGGMRIQDGYLEDFEFFKWLSEQFEIPSLRRIDFRNLSIDFAVKRQESRMFNLLLDSRDVNMRGFFTLAGPGMVTSTLSLSLSNPVLNESPRFQRLVRVMRDAHVDHMRFDFQLSGLLCAMNFKWMESDFKRELQRKIPNFIERRIEHGIEDLLSPSEAAD